MDAQARGLAAQQLLDNETFQHLLGKLESEAVDALARANVSDPASLVQATADLQAARRLRSRAQSLVTTGNAVERTPVVVP